LKSILVPTDFSAPSQNAIRYAIELAKQFGATITLLHVVEPIVVLADAYGWTNAPSIITDTALQKTATRRLAALLKEQSVESVPVKPLVRAGKPFQEIVSVAKKGGNDLIIIATHGHTGLAHILLGSTAERVVRHAPCPVLVVREGEREFI